MRASVLPGRAGPWAYEGCLAFRFRSRPEQQCNSLRPSDPRTTTNPQNKFVDIVYVFNYIRLTLYDKNTQISSHHQRPQTMPIASTCAITGPVNTQDDLNNPFSKILGCILSNLASLQGPIVPKGDMFSPISIYCRVSFEFLFWPFLACQNGNTEQTSKSPYS